MGQNSRAIVFGFVLLALTVLACAGPVMMGDLSLEATPIAFTLYEDYIRTWYADVTPESHYEIIVTREDSTYPTDWLNLSVDDYRDRQSIVTAQIKTVNSVGLVFVAPRSGRVRIVVDAYMAGEEGEGTFTIQLREVRQ